MAAMALSLTCGCGARFELEDTLAGQTIVCPECQQSLKAPILLKPPVRTSNLALASMVLALVGAFTLVGTAVAVLLGLMALVDIRRNRDKLAGLGLALFGILAGIGLTALTAFALFGGEVFGFAGNLREVMLADQVDTTGALEIIDRTAGFAITRPSKKWGVVLTREIEDPFVQGFLHKDADLLLVQTARYVFLDVRSEPTNPRDLNALNSWQQRVLAEFGHNPEDPLEVMNPRGFPGRQPPAPNDPENAFRPKGFTNLSTNPFDVPGGEGRELRLDVKVAGKNWAFLIRLINNGSGRLYVVRAFAPSKKAFQSAFEEIAQALDSFRPLPTR
jgi:Domain of unknown function (DUF4190)